MKQMPFGKAFNIGKFCPENRLMTLEMGKIKRAGKTEKQGQKSREKRRSERKGLTKPKNVAIISGAVLKMHKKYGNKLLKKTG